MSERLGRLSPRPDGSKGVRRSSIIVAVRTGLQHPSVKLPLKLAQNRQNVEAAEMTALQLQCTDSGICQSAITTVG